MSLNTFKFIKLKKKCQDVLYNSISDSLDIINPQSYIPVFSKYNNFNNDFSKKMIILNNKYILLKLEKIENIKEEIKLETLQEQNNHKINETIKGNMYAYLIDKDIYTKSKDYNDYKNYIKKQVIFIKSNPLLNVISYMENQYVFENGIPSINSFLTNNIINNNNNNAYIEVICCYFLNILQEQNLTTLFPYYFGSFNGYAKNYIHDISEDYEHIKELDWFSMKNDILKYEIIKENTLDDYQDIEFENISLLDYNKEKTLQNNNNKSLSSLDSIDLDLQLDDIFSNKTNNNITDSDESVESDSDNDSLLSIESMGSCMISETFVKINNFPIQCVIMETFDMTLTEYDKKNISIDEWKTILFEICFGMAIAQKHLNFIHNDLHSDNIMFKKINKQFKYYNYNNTYFKVPTYNKETKIIDFARGIIKIGSKLYFSDVFKKGGDAYGQYNYLNKKIFYKHKYLNYSFDLARLSITLLKYLDFTNKNEIENYLKELIILKNNKYINMDEDDFSVYVDLCENAHNAIPKNQLLKPIFKNFIINKEEIPDNENIYIL